MRLIANNIFLCNRKCNRKMFAYRMMFFIRELSFPQRRIFAYTFVNMQSDELQVYMCMHLYTSVCITQMYYFFSLCC